MSRGTQLYLRENLSAGIIGVVLIPGLLPLPVLLAGMAAGSFWTIAALTILVGKALLIRHVAGVLGVPPRPAADLFFEIAGELLVPLHVLTAMLKPRHIRWRNRNFVLKGRRIVDG